MALNPTLTNNIIMNLYSTLLQKNYRENLTTIYSTVEVLFPLHNCL